MRAKFSTGVAALCALALTACGGEASEEAAAPAEAPETAEAAPAEAPAAEEPAAEAVAFADLTGDAANGKTVFTKCMSCHVIEDGVNRVGPHLYGVVDRAAGAVDGFNYTAANADSGITWSKDILFEYLEAPQEYLPGTRMAFPGIKDAQERADLIEYLAANGEV